MSLYNRKTVSIRDQDFQVNINGTPVGIIGLMPALLTAFPQLRKRYFLLGMRRCMRGGAMIRTAAKIQPTREIQFLIESTCLSVHTLITEMGLPYLYGNRNMIKTDAAFGAASVCSLVAVLPMHQHGLCSIRIKSARNIELSKAFELIVFRVPSCCNAIVVILIDCVTLNRDIEIGRTPFLSRKDSIHIRA